MDSLIAATQTSCLLRVPTDARLDTNWTGMRRVFVNAMGCGIATHPDVEVSGEKLAGRGGGGVGNGVEWGSTVQMRMRVKVFKIVLSCASTLFK